MSDEKKVQESNVEDLVENAKEDSTLSKVLSYQESLGEVDRLRVALSKSRKQILFLSFAVLALIAVAFKMAGNQMVVVVPATATKPFWVSNKGSDPSNYENMALFAIQLIKNFTPKNIAYKQEKFLQMVDPAYYGAVQNYLLSEREYVQNNNLSQVFEPNGAKIDQRNLSVAITGDVLSWVNKDPLPRKRKTYLVRFGFKNGFISILSVQDLDKKG